MFIILQWPDRFCDKQQIYSPAFKMHNKQDKIQIAMKTNLFQLVHSWNGLRIY